MKALLMIPYVPLDVVYGEMSGDIGSVMPSLGIFYLASYLDTVGKHKVDILDANVLKMGPDDVLSYISGRDYECIGFTSTTLGYPYAIDYARLLRGKFPAKKLVIGGAHAQGDPMGILKDNPGLFDYVCYGEGEFAFETLLDYLDGSASEKDLRGWTYLKNGRVETAPPADIPDILDVFGHPAKLLPKEWVPLYHEKILAYKKLPMFSIVGSRGCPFKCTFCTTPRKFKNMYQNRVRFHSIEWIIEEMKILENEFGICEINFWDDTFNVRRDRVMEFCRQKNENNLGVIWSCNFEANIADIEMMKTMKSAGCWSIMVGGESGSDRILTFIKKGVTTMQLRLVASWSNQVGLVSRPSFIIGLPSDTEESINETIQFVKDSGFHFPYFQLYVPLPGTEMYEHLGEYGEIVVKDPKERSASRVNYLPKGLTEEFLLKSYRRAYRSVYLNWKMIRNHVQFIRSFEDITRYWKGFRTLFKI